MIPHRKPVQEDNVDSWLMSYADMITLLLCFFIIFVSVSEPKKERITQITSGMAGKFGTVDLSTPFVNVYQNLQATIEKHQLFREVAIEKTQNSVELEVSTNLLFATDSADIRPDAVPVLEEMAAAFKTIEYVDYRITIEGHTNDVPVSTQVFPTNWELSAVRATNVVRFLIERGILPEHLKASGLAGTQPKVPNLDANGNAIVENRARNQRIVIKIERSL